MMIMRYRDEPGRREVWRCTGCDWMTWVSDKAMREERYIARTQHQMAMAHGERCQGKEGTDEGSTDEA